MEYPDPEEDFHELYADELELLKEVRLADERDALARRKSKRSLDFSDIFGPGPSQQSSSFSKEGVRPLDFNQESLSGGRGVKHTVDDLFGDIADIEEEVALKGHQQEIVCPKSKCSTSSSAISEPGPSQENTGIGNRGVKPPEVNQGPLSVGRVVKRTVDDLFDGMTSDPVKANRKKKYEEMTKEEKNEDLIARILYLRDLTKRAKLGPKHKEEEEKQKRKLSTTIPSGPYVTLVNGQNKVLYAELISEEDFEAEVRSTVAKIKKEGGLLSEPYSTVQDKALEYLKKREEAAALEASAQSKAVMVVDSGHGSDSKELWVQKYKPSCYMELLSDATSNRTLLKWLKFWDKVVFNRERQVRPNRKRKYSKISILDEKLDKNNCPKQKIALLHGAPGSGKTTLAHLLARHCGYNAVEVNASDDRSPEAFRIQLEAATQMKSVMGKTPRPNCLILDEIDGAPAAAIELLVKFVMGQDSGGKTKRGKKKNKQTNILKRPIICICNELYVPALRPLRQIALVIQLPEVSTARIAKRLSHIANQEGLKTDEYVLMALAEKANSDIRSCLATLQFLKACKKEITCADIKMDVGQKDMHKGLFQVWQEIFQITRPKWYTTKPEHLKYTWESMSVTSLPDEVRATNILLSVRSCGDYERLVQGVFENYPTMRYWDTRMKATLECLEWFCAVDLMNHHMHTTQNYSLLAYIPYAFVKWHFIFGNIFWPKIKFPTADYEASVKKSRGKQVLKQLVSGMSPRAKIYNNERTLILEKLPLLLHILSPDLPSVNVLLYSQKERQEMNRVTSLMLINNLQFIQERTPEGNYDYVLDPNLDILVRFPQTSHNEGSSTLSYIVKQILAREIHFALIRLNESVPPVPPEIDYDVPSTSSQKSPAKSKRSKKTKGKAKLDQASLPRLTDFFQPEPEDPKQLANIRRPYWKIPKNFGRWYHFREGFINAVRKSIRASTLNKNE